MICVVIRIYFLIGVGERLDVFGFFDVFWEGEGKRRRGVMKGVEEVVVRDGVGDFEVFLGLGLGFFFFRRFLEFGEVMWEMGFWRLGCGRGSVWMLRKGIDFLGWVFVYG